MNRVYQETIQKIESMAALCLSVLVSYSGGKDSLVVMDLCKKHFQNVKAFFMYFVPGLSVCERQLDYARQKWGVEIIQYPHWNYIQCLKQGVYCLNSTAHDKFPEWKLADVYNAVRHDTGVDLIATGSKASDSRWRKFNLKNGTGDNVLVPLLNWNKFDVLAYLKINGIPVPDSSGGQATGVDLSTPSILWLHDNHPEDFQKLLKHFPLAQAAIKRRDEYGVGR